MPRDQKNWFARITEKFLDALAITHEPSEARQVPLYIPESLSGIFKIGRDRILTFKARVVSNDSETKAADAVLLLLYGYSLSGEDDISASDLLVGLERFGPTETLNRIDRTIAYLLEEKFVVKKGVRRGSKYAITRKGITLAESKLIEVGWPAP